MQNASAQRRRETRHQQPDDSQPAFAGLARQTHFDVLRRNLHRALSRQTFQHVRLVIPRHRNAGCQRCADQADGKRRDSENHKPTVAFLF